MRAMRSAGFGARVRHASRCLALLAALAACSDKPTQPGSEFPFLVDVYMPNISTYSPVQAEIARTGTVRFNFPFEEHNVIFLERVAATPADIPITMLAVVSRKFDVAGTYNYYCTLHPQMVALIVVH